jgi:hypothetical protein
MLSAAKHLVPGLRYGILPDVLHPALAPLAQDDISRTLPGNVKPAAALAGICWASCQLALPLATKTGAPAGCAQGRLVVARSR